MDRGLRILSGINSFLPVLLFVVVYPSNRKQSRTYQPIERSHTVSLGEILTPGWKRKRKSYWLSEELPRTTEWTLRCICFKEYIDSSPMFALGRSYILFFTFVSVFSICFGLCMLKELLPDTFCLLLLVSFLKNTFVSVYNSDKEPATPEEENKVTLAHRLRGSSPWVPVLVLWAGGSTGFHGSSMWHTRPAGLTVGRKQRQNGPGLLTSPLVVFTLWPNFFLLGSSSYRFFPTSSQWWHKLETKLKAC